MEHFAAEIAMPPKRGLRSAPRNLRAIRKLRQGPFERLP